MLGPNAMRVHHIYHILRIFTMCRHQYADGNTQKEAETDAIADINAALARYCCRTPKLNTHDCYT